MTQHNDNDKLREALCQIDALYPEGRLGGISHGAMTGLVERMGNIAQTALQASDPTPQWQAHEPVEGAVAPDGAVWGLVRCGDVRRVNRIGAWDDFPDRPTQIIAYCTSAEPPAKDADGMYAGTGVQPISEYAKTMAELSGATQLGPAMHTPWQSVIRWRPVGAE